MPLVVSDFIGPFISVSDFIGPFISVSDFIGPFISNVWHAFLPYECGIHGYQWGVTFFFFLGVCTSVGKASDQKESPLTPRHSC